MADAQLLQYVVEQERAGISEERIRQALATNGYPQAAIDDVFKQLRPTAPDPAVHDYAQQYANQGYTAAQTFAALVQQGFVPAKVRRSVLDVYGQGTLPPQVHAGVLVFIGIAVLLGGGALFFLLNNDSSTPDVQTQLPAGNVALSAPEIIAQILEVARTDGKTAGVAACDARLSGRDRDLCVLDVAVLDAVGDVTLCSQITDIEYHDTCLLNFIAQEYDLVCANVRLPASKSTCASIASLRGAA